MKSKSVVLLAISALFCVALRGSDPDLWKSSDDLRRLGAERIALDDFREGIPLLQTAVERDPGSVPAVAALANAYHLQRRLDEAAVQYLKLLQLKGSFQPSKEQEEAIFRFAPR